MEYKIITAIIATYGPTAGTLAACIFLYFKNKAAAERMAQLEKRLEHVEATQITEDKLHLAIVLSLQPMQKEMTEALTGLKSGMAKTAKELSTDMNSGLSRVYTRLGKYVETEHCTALRENLKRDH